MTSSDPESTDVRAFMMRVAEEFRRLDPSARPKAVLEPADAAESFEYTSCGRSSGSADGTT